MATDLQAHVDSTLRSILISVVSPDNALRTEAERMLNLNFIIPNPEETILSLARLMRNDTDFMLRGLSAVLIRRVSLQNMPTSGDKTPVCRILAISSKGCDSICTELLLALTSEKTSNVRNKICDCVAEISRTLIEADRAFPNLIQFISQCLQSSHYEFREICHRILNVVPQILMPQGVLNTELLSACYATCLSETENASVRVAALNSAVGVILEALDANSPKSHTDFFERLVVQMLNVLPPLLAAGNENHLEDSLAALIDLAAPLPTLFRPIAAQLFEFAIPLITNLEIDSKVRHPALELVMTLIDEAPRMMRKCVPNLAERLIPVCLLMMADLDDDDTAEWEALESIEIDNNQESDENYIVGEQSMDRIARKLGAKVVTPVAFSILPTWINSNDWRQRHAALMAISAIAEGCFRTMQEKLPKILEIVTKTVSDSHPRVRHALCNCIGQLCTDFSPKIQELFHQPIIAALSSAMQNEGHPRVQAHGAAAIINFCERVPRRDLECHLEHIVQLLGNLCSHPKIYVRSQAITSLATVADAAEEKFATYAPAVFPLLFSILDMKNDAMFRELRGKALECATLIAMAIKKENLGEYGLKLLQVLILIQGQTYEPDDCMPGFLMQGWARLCEVYGSEFVPYLSLIMPPLLQSASTKPLVAVLDIEESFEKYPTDQGWVHGEVGGRRVCVRNSALEEKQGALDMLSCYARTLGTSFAPYTPSVMEIVVEQLTFELHEGVRHAAAQIIPHLLKSMEDVTTLDLLNNVSNMAYKSLLDALGKEEDNEVISTLYGALADVVSVNRSSISEEHVCVLLASCSAGLQAFYQVVEKRIEDKATDVDYDPEENVELEEQEEIENTIPLEIIKVVQALFRRFGVELLPLFEKSLLPLVIEFLGSKDETLVFVAVNMFSDVLSTGNEGLKYLTLFGEAFLRSLQSRDESIRQTAAYGIGMAAATSGDNAAAFCSAALPLLVQVIQHSQAKETDFVLATENCVSAIGRIFRHCPSAISTPEQRESLVEIFVSSQPVMFDTSEVGHTTELFCDLIESRHNVVMKRAIQVANSLIELLWRDVLRENGEDELALRVAKNLSGIMQTLNEESRRSLWSTLDESRRKALSTYGLA